jgi:quercetin dioxygenase-like cupin family protein
VNPERMQPDVVAPEILELLALGLDPIAPAAETRSRLMNGLDGPERFAPFFAQLSRLFDLPVLIIVGLLARIDDPRAWEDGVPGVKLIHFAAGPRRAAAEAGLVRLAPGACFPRHRHLGRETTIVLEGTLLDSRRDYGPGASVEHATDSVHRYAAAAARDLVIAVLHHGIAPADVPEG